MSIRSNERSRDEESDDKVEGLIIGEAIIILLMDKGKVNNFSGLKEKVKYLSGIKE